MKQTVKLNKIIGQYPKQWTVKLLVILAALRNSNRSCTSLHLWHGFLDDPRSTHETLGILKVVGGMGKTKQENKGENEALVEKAVEEGRK